MSPTAPSLAEVHDFLLGIGPIDGVWFGDSHESGRPYWWRKFLRDALARTPPPSEVSEATERCAKIAENFADTVREFQRHPQPTYTSEEMWNRVEDAGRDIADAIRTAALNQPEQET